MLPACQVSSAHPTGCLNESHCLSESHSCFCAVNINVNVPASPGPCPCSCPGAHALITNVSSTASNRTCTPLIRRDIIMQHAPALAVSKGIPLQVPRCSSRLPTHSTVKACPRDIDLTTLNVTPRQSSIAHRPSQWAAEQPACPDVSGGLEVSTGPSDVVSAASRPT